MCLANGKPSAECYGSAGGPTDSRVKASGAATGLCAGQREGIGTVLHQARSQSVLGGLHRPGLLLLLTAGFVTQRFRTQSSSNLTGFFRQCQE